MVVPSIFLKDDYKRHMSINVENGLWRCFKTGETGNFIKLYVLLERCSYQEAKVKFALEQFEEGKAFRVPRQNTHIDLRSFDTDIEDAKVFEIVKNHPFAEKRMLGDFDFMLAKSGPYKGRLIIPFFSRRSKLFYFQARALGDEMPKYLNCKNLRSSQVLYPFDYTSCEPLYITEGVFDCLSLQAVGLNATTTLSCFTSREQAMQLKDYQGPLVCAFDSDKAGDEGRLKFQDQMHYICKDEIYTISPPKPYKDWNEILVKEGGDYLMQCVCNFKKLSSFNVWLDKFEEKVDSLTYNKS